MTTNLALEYIPRRMQELGYGNKYLMRFRHIMLQPSERLKIDAYNQIYILIEEANDVSVESRTGVFDLSLQNANEMHYEHQGSIIIQNQRPEIRHVRFIQVIPKHKNK